jgi:hypothetical protein
MTSPKPVWKLTITARRDRLEPDGSFAIRLNGRTVGYAASAPEALREAALVVRAELRKADRPAPPPS